MKFVFFKLSNFEVFSSFDITKWGSVSSMHIFVQSMLIFAHLPDFNVFVFYEPWTDNIAVDVLHVVFKN